MLQDVYPSFLSLLDSKMAAKLLQKKMTQSKEHRIQNGGRDALLSANL
jgi:hypothetical protein